MYKANIKPFFLLALALLLKLHPSQITSEFKRLTMNLQKAAQLFQNGKLNEAAGLCESLLKTNQKDVQALHLRGVIAYQEKSYLKATEYLSQALELAPNNLDIKHALAASYYNVKFFKKSIILYNEICNSTAEVSNFIQLADVYAANQEFEQAISVLAKASKLAPKNVDVLFNLSRFYYHEKNYNATISQLNHLITIDCYHVNAWNLLGLTQSKLQDYSNAEVSFKRAIHIDSNYSPAYLNLASLLQELGKYEEALSNYIKAIDINKNSSASFPEAYYNAALIYLGNGDFHTGWENLKNRPKQFTDIPSLTDLEGKRILIVGEEGLGDELLFLRFLPELQKKNVTIAYKCNPKLNVLLQNHEAIDTLYNPGDDIPKYDFNISAMDLPIILNIDNPKSVKPLKLSYQSYNSIPILSDLPQKQILGITWRAGVSNEETTANKYLEKSIPLSIIGDILKDFEGTIIILQRNPSEKEVNFIKSNTKAEVIDASKLNNNLDEMLSCLDLIDNYIGVSNTNMHLYASLNKNACVLIPYPGEWRWLYAGESSPWYPNFQLIRQEEFSNWETLRLQAKNYIDSL